MLGDSKRQKTSNKTDDSAAESADVEIRQLREKGKKILAGPKQ